MANEITLTVTLEVAKGLYANSKSQDIQATQNGQGAAQGIAATSTTKSNLDVGSVTTLGYLYLMNLDASNACDWGYDNSGTFVAIGTLNAGEVACFRLKQGITVQLKAQAGTPPIEYWLLQN